MVEAPTVVTQAEESKGNAGGRRGGRGASAAGEGAGGADAMFDFDDLLNQIPALVSQSKFSQWILILCCNREKVKSIYELCNNHKEPPRWISFRNSSAAQTSSAIWRPRNLCRQL